MSGFEFHETMAGSYFLELEEDGSMSSTSTTASGDRRPPSAAAQRPMSFTIRARSRKLLDFLRRPEVEIEGEIDAEGFADHRYLSGTLGLDLVRTGTLPYAFRFTANDGRRCSFEGTKTVRASELVETMTVLPGLLLDEKRGVIGQALLRFDLRSDLLRFLKSFRAVR